MGEGIASTVRDEMNRWRGLGGNGREEERPILPRVNGFMEHI